MIRLMHTQELTIKQAKALRDRLDKKIIKAESLKDGKKEKKKFLPLPDGDVLPFIPEGIGKAASMSEMYQSYCDAVKIRASKDVFRRSLHLHVDSGRVVRREDGKFYLSLSHDIDL